MIMPCLSRDKARERKGAAQSRAIARRPITLEESETYVRMICAFQRGTRDKTNNHSPRAPQVLENTVEYAVGYSRD